MGHAPEVLKLPPRKLHPERWAAIPDTDGLYEASTYGNIRSLKTATSGKNGGLLKLSQGKRGYLTVSLLTPLFPKGRTFSVHALIMRTFIGPKPEGLEICHWDDNPENNHIGNLRYDTHEHNNFDRKFTRHAQ